MTREEAIEMLVNATYSEEWQGNEKLTTAHLMAIEALEGVCFDEWCDDCKEYDTEKKCCPRFNRVIREALKREPSEDGTLEVKVEDATKVGRVLISDGRHRGGLYYPDEDEPQGDLISRAEAIEHFMRLSEDESLTPYTQMLMVGVSNEIKKIPSADRPRGSWHYSDGKPATIGQSFGVICDQCGAESEYCTNFCGECGADMRGDMK